MLAGAADWLCSKPEAVMTPQAANLSDQEITDLSAYYSKQ